ncbi:MAG TPA: hypothetical protein VE267_03820, partial [Bradyrhizobium sp.]|nr:hypothetical protein [Bradyrhizobium sp.]
LGTYITTLLHKAEAAATVQAPIFASALTRLPQRLPVQELDRPLEYDLAISHMLSTPRTRVPDNLHLKRAGGTGQADRRTSAGTRLVIIL